MAVSARGQGGLLLRVDPAEAESLVSEPPRGPVEMGGRRMYGWLRVDAAAVEADDDLRRWVGHGVTYSRSLRPQYTRCRGRTSSQAEPRFPRVTGG